MIKKMSKVTIGGVEFVVGGWGRYEITRRREEYEATKKYGGSIQSNYKTKYIYPDDVVNSVLNSERKTPLRRAAIHLAESLKRAEDQLCGFNEDGSFDCVPFKSSKDHFTLPPITSDNIKKFTEDIYNETDINTLNKLKDDVENISTSMKFADKKIKDLHSLGSSIASQRVNTQNIEDVLALEENMAPHIDLIEQMQIELVNKMEKIASNIDRMIIQ